MKTAILNKPKNYQACITVNADAKDAFEKIAKVNEWWASNIEGNTQKKGNVFTVRFGETFVTFKIAEAVPGKKTVWHVTDCYLHWIKDKKEWNDTKVVFTISEKHKETIIDMEHIGLTPAVECYTNCEKGWDFYIKQSLHKFITTGKGMPEKPKALK
ncbi:MAG TPA: hypothetical protein VMT76_11155 [Puia sp.]|nr:hypothetical protein [Puia sp.]